MGALKTEKNQKRNWNGLFLCLCLTRKIWKIILLKNLEIWIVRRSFIFKNLWQKISKEAAILSSVLDEKLDQIADKRKRIICYGIQNFEFVAYVIKKIAATDLTFICCSVDHPITFIQKVAKVRSILFYFYPLRSCP